jgi:hypothetical protein
MKVFSHVIYECCRCTVLLTDDRTFYRFCAFFTEHRVVETKIQKLSLRLHHFFRITAVYLYICILIYAVFGPL